MTFRETGSDVDEPVTVRIGRPVPGENQESPYTAEFEIDGPGDHHHAHHVYGEDSVQALANAFVVLNGLLDAVRRDGTISWHGSKRATRLPTY